VKRYSLGGVAGLVESRRNRLTGTTIGLYQSLQSGIDSHPEWPWTTVCEEHGTLVCHRTLAIRPVAHGGARMVRRLLRETVPQHQRKRIVKKTTKRAKKPATKVAKKVAKRAPTAAMKKASSREQQFERWKAEAQDIATELAGIDDIWAKDDPYDLGMAAASAFDSGRSARVFIEEVFADDIASRQYDDELRETAEQYEHDDEPDDDYDYETEEE